MENPEQTVAPRRSLNASHINHEEYRLCTFKSWPTPSPISFERLARAGFYYLGNGFEVVCFSCNGKISNWIYGDIAMTKHKSTFPDCDFVNIRSTNVLFINDKKTFKIEVTSSSVEVLTSSPRDSNHIYRMSNSGPEKLIGRKILQPINLAYLSKESRMETFDSWPRSLSFVRTEDLVDAGFFYTKFYDSVTCFSCNGTLSDWEPGDIPWFEHIRLFPKCKFIQTYADEILSDDNVTPVIPTHTDERLLDDSIIPTQTSERLLDDNVISAISNTSKSSTIPNIISKSQLSSLGNVETEEIGRSMCKICMDEEMSIVLFPCRHFVSCLNCSQALVTCPLCRSEITEKIRTYWA